QSPLLGTVMACLLVVPLILLLSAELRVGAEAAALLFGRPVAHTATLLAITIMIVVGASGLRSQTWSGVAMAIAALLAFIVPIAIVATMETFLPIPQLSHGPVLRALGRTEALQTLPQIQLPPLSMTLPGQDLSILSGRFASQTTMLGTLAFALLSLIVAFGVAGSPSLLPRCGAAPSVYDSRKSLGWAAVVLIIMVTTMSAVAVLTRDLVLKQAIGSNPAALASWLRDWIGLGLAQVDASGERVDVTRLAFRRDGILYLLPHAHGLPHVVVAVAVAGAVAASLLAACQAAVALSSILVDDIMFGSRLAAGNETRRLLMARASLGLATLAALAVVANVQVDPLQLVLWSLCLSAATAFPVMVLSVWWKNLTGRGAMSGALAGFSVTALAMLLAEGGVLALASPLSALLGTPITFAVAIAVSLLAHGPGRAELEIIRDVRVPGGETFVDREVRQERARGRKT
ncbi:MAG TPA: hypothetical protein PK264_01085, partial [Hyphomicrobiaceae bacterium]|nr:hypothetical protein [Hyphomicrobiaceae bacterium]